MPPTAEAGFEDDWMKNGRTVLICRELFRTEKGYLSRLEQMFFGAMIHVTPTKLARHIPRLIETSRGLLELWEKDSSGSAIATTFLHYESDLETAFTGWSAVVGGLFSDGQALVLTSSRRMRPLSDAGHGRKSPIISPPEENERSARRKSQLIKKKDLKLSLREVAIAPIQRVTRYVLLFRDLLQHTPTSSPSYESIANALHCAMRIAEKCDRAQANSAFHREEPRAALA